MKTPAVSRGYQLAKSISRRVVRGAKFGVGFLQDLLSAAFFRFSWPTALRSEFHDRATFISHLRSERLTSFFVWPAEAPALLEALNRLSPGTEALIVARADQICDHCFDLLGSGITSLGDKIDWHVDFKSGHRWNPKTYFKRIRKAPYPGGYDIKVPWELSRCQHFVSLGQAYWITHDEKYCLEFIAETNAWIMDNPWPWGVNWSCTMEVAIRAVNWLWAYHFFMDSPSLTDDFLISFYRSLLIHGRHIQRNLENRGPVQNNHYLADLAGLIYLGILCPEFKEASEWREFGLHTLWQELFKQTYSDGADFEASISYHRLATELFLSAAILCRLNNIQLAEDVLCRLEKMIEFVMAYTKPDGTVPQFGDADNGRLHRLKVWDPPEGEWLDHRYLLAIGAVLFERKDFAQAAGDQWEDAIWMLWKDTISFQEKMKEESFPPLKISSTGLDDSGFQVLRNSDLYVMVDAGPNGQNGHGGHAHNDWLGFEFSTVKENWIVDPGLFAYTLDYCERNKCRSTAAHSVVMVDGEEINEFDEKKPFHLPETTRPVILKRAYSENVDFLLAQHRAYHRLPSPVTHSRSFALIKPESILLVHDRLDGIGKHRADIRFQLGKNIVIKEVDNFNIQLKSTASDEEFMALYALSCLPCCKVQTIKSNIHPSYGINHQAFILEYSLEANFPIDLFWCFLILEKNESIPDDVEIRRKIDFWMNQQDILEGHLNANSACS